MTKKTARALFPLICSFLLLLAVAVVTAVLVAGQERDAKAVATAMQVRGGLIELFSALQDAETGQRGFLLKGEPAYLQPYLSATSSMNARFDMLAAAYEGNAVALQKLSDLRHLADRKLAELKETIDLKKRGDDQAAVQIVGTDRGIKLMDQIRAIVADLRAGNVSALTERQIRAKLLGRFVEVSIALAIFAAILAAGFVFNDARRREMRLVAAIEEREASNLALSAAVERREKVEDQLRQAQKMEAVGQLTGGLAHDFNNMLGVIIGSLMMLKRRTERGETNLGSYVEMALQGAERAANLTQRLLAFSRQQPLAPEVLQLNKILPSLSELLRRTLGEMVQLETVLGGGLWYTKVDANQLESSIINLAVNARDAMPDGGKLTLETANVHLDDGYTAQNPGVIAGQYVMLAMTDSGQGMSADVLKKAFDPFFTTKGVGRGTGLGLSQVYGFVKQSGGHVKIYSELGKGTTVRIYMQRSFDTIRDSQLVGLKRSPAEIPVSDRSKIILVVEDEAEVRRLTVDTLRDLNYTVIHASDGVEALTVLESDYKIDLLLTDVVMPKLSGKQLVDRARAIRPDLRVLFMTGYTRNSIVHNGVIDPGVQLISKPFTLEQLAAKVRTCIDG